MYLYSNEFTGGQSFHKVTFFETVCKLPKEPVLHSASQGSSAIMVITHVANPIKIAWGEMSVHCSHFTLQSVVNSVRKLHPATFPSFWKGGSWWSARNMQSYQYNSESWFHKHFNYVKVHIKKTKKARNLDINKALE